MANDLSALIARLEAGPARLLDALDECKRHNDRGLLWAWSRSGRRPLSLSGRACRLGRGV